MLIRLLIIVGILFLVYKLFTWVPQAMSSTVACPRCEGKGHWYGLRHREECKACGGSGRLPK